MINNENGEIRDPKILKHINTVLKCKVGETIRVGVLNQNIFTGLIKVLEPHYCKLELLKGELPKLPWFNLVLGLSRPQTIKKILEHGTTFGAKSFFLFKAELSEKSYLDSKIFLDQAYLEYMTDGLSQSGVYTHLPMFSLEKYNAIEQYQNLTGQKFILDLTTDETFDDYPIDLKHPITLAIGPERGWIKSEIDTFNAAGFKSIKISSSILRVEHAFYSDVSQLELKKLKLEALSC